MANYTNKLIMNNNLYYVADEVLEADLDNLVPIVENAESEANVGKEAIIDATELKTGMPVIPRTYPQVVHDLNNITPVRFDFLLPGVRFDYASYNATISVNTNWTITPDFWCKFGLPYQYHIAKTPFIFQCMHERPQIPEALSERGFVLRAQCLVDIPENTEKVLPIFLHTAVSSGNNGVGMYIYLRNTSAVNFVMGYQTGQTSMDSETFSVESPLLGKKFIELEIDFTVDVGTVYKVYVADAVEDRLEKCGYLPSNRVLLVTHEESATAGYYIARAIWENRSRVGWNNYYPLSLEAGGSISGWVYNSSDRDNTAIQTNALGAGLMWVSKSDRTLNMTLGNMSMEGIVR